jgi:hypothetical protein
MSMEHSENYPNTQRGATRQTRRLPALRPKLKDMMDGVDNPHDIEDRKAVKDQFLQFMDSAAGAQYRKTAYLYWFENNYRSMLPDHPEPDKEIALRIERKVAAQAVREKTAAELTHRVEKAIETKAQIILLDLVMPNGKTLRESNRTDCKQAGGWYMKLADRLKGKQTVGDVWQEADVRKLLPADQRAP